ncbi:hypothetical protein VVD49_03200 [Uliginosibacterium sp. H3]|uniref:Uncharacterized protein n=1 Tax=Uliginosibacterium silvisoli TaxID=3114758 RepID=A0ABU6JZW0_9RHOO|nr:hypothetical protein [Uliginosibacterium sp. H3]
MDPTFIPRKTTSGTEEIRTRAHKLEARLRALLIQIDGNKRVGDLQATIGAGAAEDLRKLHELGLVGWDDSLSNTLANQRRSSTPQ